MARLSSPNSEGLSSRRSLVPYFQVGSETLPLQIALPLITNAVKYED